MLVLVNFKWVVTVVWVKFLCEDVLEYNFHESAALEIIIPESLNFGL